MIAKDVRGDPHRDLVAADVVLLSSYGPLSSYAPFRVIMGLQTITAPEGSYGPFELVWSF